MPTKSYRFYDPVHQTSFQHTLQTSDSAKTEDGHHRWSQSIMRQDFEDAQRGQDMRHIVPQASWIQYDLSKAKPIRPLGTEPIVFTQPINLYLLSGDKTWIHCGAAILTFNDGTSRASKQAWVMLHSHGTHRHVGSFSIFHGMEVIRFNDSVLVTTVQVTPESPAARFVSYAFQTETIDQASQLRQALATAACDAVPSGTSASERRDVVNPREAVEEGMERRLSSWIHAVEEQYASMSVPVTCPESSGIVYSAPRLRRRGGIDHGSAYWDMEKARALEEARTELDSLQLKRLLSGVQLTV